MLTHVFIILLHVVSVFAGVAAAILWFRSADIDIPDIAPTKHHKNKEGSLSDEWIEQFSANLKSHRKQWLKSTRYNKAAASAAAGAAMAQAIVYLLNLINLIM